jgi:glycosyltransferase involved in cell wall biosynthesis
MEKLNDNSLSKYKLTKLLVLCDNYPNGLGEFFLDDEMLIAAEFFDEIIIFSPEQKELFKHNVPKNLKQFNIENELIILDVISSLLFIFSKDFIVEIFKDFNVNFFNKLKICLADVLKSSQIIRSINKNINSLKINQESTIFYSYWHDYKALALARMQKNSKSLFVSRAHSSDIFTFRSKYHYLPFKKYILTKLDSTLSISEQGKNELSKYLAVDSNKVKISRLGKNNERKPILLKTSDKYIVCSCSHFNKLKRVHLIPKILKEMNMSNVHWVHFGWGYPEYEQKVLDELKDVSFTYELRGKIENEVILDYYNQNFVDLFINLSTHEGIPVSIMEAFSAGIPVLATNVGATAEIVDESCGFLVESKINTTSLSEIIKDFLFSGQENIEKKRRNAYNKWFEMYNADLNYKRFYEELIQLHVEKNS